MTDTTQATARPWHCADRTERVMGDPTSFETCPIFSEMDRLLAQAGGATDHAETLANASLIVTAVNQHDALTAEVERLRGALQGLAGEGCIAERMGGGNCTTNPAARIQCYACRARHALGGAH